MSEAPLPNYGNTDTVAVDNTIQRELDRHAIPDLTVDLESQLPPRALTSPSASNATIATKAFDSLPAYDSTTALGDAFARAESTDLADEDFDAPDRGDFH